MSQAANANTKSPDFVTSRVFDAPRELLWRCFADPKHMSQWWGPKGSKVVHSQMDLRPGGTYHYSLKAPDGSVMWGMMRYREIVPPERIVFINSFSDETGGITRHPYHAVWPLEMMTVMTFEDAGEGRTRFTARWTPFNATPKEQHTFDTNHDSMHGGWGGMLDQLAVYLTTVR